MTGIAKFDESTELRLLLEHAPHRTQQPISVLTG